MSRSADLRQRAADVGSLQADYLRLVSVSELSWRAGTVTMRMRAPWDGLEDEFARQLGIVGMAAGRAERAVGVHARNIAVDRLGTRSPSDPIVSRRLSLDDPETPPPDTTTRYCERVIGLLDADAEEAGRLERSAVGRLARFISFPARVRAAVAIDHRAMARAAFSAGAVGQVVVTASAGLIVILLTSLCSWLISQAF